MGSFIDGCAERAERLTERLRVYRPGQWEANILSSTLRAADEWLVVRKQELRIPICFAKIAL